MEAIGWKRFCVYHQSKPAWALTTQLPHVLLLMVRFAVLFDPPTTNVGKLRSVVAVAFANKAAPVSVADNMTELPAVGIDPSVPDGG